MTPAWLVRDRRIPLDRPLVMGVLNVTPDSFSDGGVYATFDAALSRATRMVEEGADLIDVGGESTRPQTAVAVAADEECRRVLPVVRALADRFPTIAISVDTSKSAVARAALEAGAHIVNDVSAMRLDSAMGAVVAEAGAGVVLMHSRGDVSSMGTYEHAEYSGDPLDAVTLELRVALHRAREAGVVDAAIVLDPGIGFAKRTAHSLRVLAGLGQVLSLGFPVMVGVSRKRFIGELSGVAHPAARMAGSVGAAVVALTRGASIFRVHDVGATREALDVAAAILASPAA